MGDSRSRLPTTAGGLVRFGTRLLTEAHLVFGHGLPQARDEALFLTLHALGLSIKRWLPALPVSPAAASRAHALFERRIRERRPAAYLTCEAWLGDQRFYVDERVLVPRSYIAEWLLDRTMPLLPAVRSVHNALDLCTGSGCLAVLLAKHFRYANVDATDVSAPALKVARINVKRHRLDKRVRVLRSDYFNALAHQRYNLIVSNPPYVRNAVMRRLPQEYRHEPSLALAAGNDGLDALRVILRDAASHLTPGGVLIVECGHARARVERTWPRLPFFWLETSGGDDCVFMLRREELTAG